MRKVLPAILVIALVAVAAACGGSEKKTQKLSRGDYVASMNRLCASANDQVAALRLTTAIGTWKRNGQKAAQIAKATVVGFKFYTPPDELRSLASEYISASEEIAAAVQDAADAAKAGNVTKFDDAISRQQNAGQKGNALAGRIGAKSCA
ncbi:MAG: hypothetical protein H0W87_04955 [Actinobacteria bacterium]|nr:hypothetical protein [Actinomycetota bacterium]